MLYKTKCLYLNKDFKGVVKFEDKSLEVNNLLDGEEAELIIDKSKRYINAKVNKIIKPNKDRIDIKCPFFNECGSCRYLHVSYERELEEKKKYVSNLFKDKLRYTSDIKINSLDPYYYRNKVIISFRMSKSKKVTAGLYEESSHNIVSINDCLIQDKRINKIIKAIIESVNQNHIEPYDEDRYKGILRHALIRIATNGDALICFVTPDSFFPGSKNLCQSIIKKCPEVKTIIQNINPRDTSIVLGDREKILYGTGSILTINNGLKFLVSSKSFYQVNEKMSELLYQKALDFAELKKTDTFLETYSGVGTIGLIASSKVKRVVSVELNVDAFKDAIKNASINKITNVQFINKDSTEYMEDIVDSNRKFDCILLDPPRSGTTKEFIDSATSLKPNKIIYISCDPNTLVRDLVQFKAHGYDIDKVELFDLFPRTEHVETVVLLSRA